MAKVKIQGHASGTGVLTVTAPNTSTDRTITLPDSTGTLATTADVPSSITDNGNATAITIDSDENVLIGKTTYVGGSGVTGIDIRPAGMVNIAREGDTLMFMNRKTSDGDIVEFRKDGTTKGSIGVTSSGAYITLGGTAAANTLDDYEEGTFIPTFIGDTNPTVTYHEKQGYYTKIGNMVYIRIWMRTASVSNTGTSTLYIDNLPFTVASSNQSKGGIVKGHIQNWGTIPENLFFYGGATSIYLWDETNGTTHKTNILASGADKNQISCEGFYEVA